MWVLVVMTYVGGIMTNSLQITFNEQSRCEEVAEFLRGSLTWDSEIKCIKPFKEREP